MTPVLISSLLIAAFLFGAQLMLRPVLFLRSARMVFIVLLIGKLLLAGYYTYQQYFIWLAHPLARILLPPYQSWQYFFSYSLFNFYLIPALVGFVALVILLTAKFADKKFQGRFFEPAEPYLAGSGILLVGHPGWIYYLSVILLAALLSFAFRFLIFRASENRLSLYYFWLPIAALAIISSKVLSLVASG